MARQQKTRASRSRAEPAGPEAAERTETGSEDGGVPATALSAPAVRWDVDEDGSLGRRIDQDDVDDGAGYAILANVEQGPPPASPVMIAAPGRMPPLALPELLPDMFINRELSWLEFNRRVLSEATEPKTPVLERAKFVAIFSDNLDGWFMIRMAGVKRKVVAGITTVGPDGRTPVAQFAVIRKLAQELMREHARVIRDQLIPDLAAEGIRIVRMDDLSTREKAGLAELFERDIFPVLTPQGIDAGRPFPHVSSGSLNHIVVLRDNHARRFARIKIPATLPSLVPVHSRILTDVGGDPDESDGTVRYVWIEDLIRAHSARLFPGVEVLAVYPFQVLRDADVEPDEEDDDRHNLMAIMRETLSQRPFGPIVRVLVQPDMPDEVRVWLTAQLNALPEDVYTVDGPLAGDSFFELMRLDRPDLKDAPFVPARVRFGHQHGDEPPSACEIFAAIRERDVVVHHPYQSFDAFVDFIRAASTDPDVVAIKQTLYRLGKNSPLIPALIDARDDDTQVAVLVELRARFDEESNIQWAEALERRGVHVAYGLAGIKTHCKATMVVRREADGMRRYVHLGTGNYNASTARTYEDLGVFSANEDLGADVAELFNSLTGFSDQDNYRRIWVAPRELRQHILQAIADEIDAHKRTGKGYLVFKMNQLVDRQSIKALHAASRAGVKVDLIVRGICSLRPGVRGWSENIRVISIVGRFLEHSRIYAFANGGEGHPNVYLGSADLMERNLERRVEVVFPVLDPEYRDKIMHELIPAYLRDTVNAQELQADRTWKPRKPENGKRFDVQAWLMKNYGQT